MVRQPPENVKLAFSLAIHFFHLFFLPGFLHTPLMEGQPLSGLSPSGALALRSSQGGLESFVRLVEGSAALQGSEWTPKASLFSEGLAVAYHHKAHW